MEVLVLTVVILLVFKNIIDNTLISDAAFRVNSLYLENYHNKNYSISIIDGTSENMKCAYEIMELEYGKDVSMLCSNQSYYGVFIVNPLFRQETLSDTIKNSPEHSIIIGIPYDNPNDAINAFSSLKDYVLGSEMVLDLEEDDMTMISVNQHGNEWNDFLMTTHYIHLEYEEDYFIHMIMGRIDNIVLLMIEKNNLQSRKYNLGRTTRDSESINDYVSGRMQTIKDLSVIIIE